MYSWPSPCRRRTTPPTATRTSWRASAPPPLSRSAATAADRIRSLENLSEEHPRSFKVWEALGWAYWDDGRQEEALQIWESVRLLMPEDPRVMRLLAKAYTARDDLEKAAEIRRAELDFRDDDDTRFQLARVLRWQSRTDDAIALLEKLYRDRPGDLALRYELGRAYLSNKEYNLAPAALDRPRGQRHGQRRLPPLARRMPRPHRQPRGRPRHPRVHPRPNTPTRRTPSA